MNEKISEDDLRKSMNRPLTHYDLHRVLEAMDDSLKKPWDVTKNAMLNAGLNELERIRTEPQVGEAVEVEPPSGTSTTISPHSDNDPPPPQRRRRR